MGCTQREDCEMQVAGEAAGYGLGLLFVGTASEKTFEMLAYAHDTQHEKIIRGLSMGLALIMYGRCATLAPSPCTPLLALRSLQ